MPNDLLQLCTAKFEAKVEGLFKNNPPTHMSLAGCPAYHAPLIEYCYLASDEKRIQEFKRLVRNALAASEWFRQHAPSWALPLPVSCAELDYIHPGLSPRLQLRQEFGRSLRHHEWDYTAHPKFYPYACSVMACEYAESINRYDRELRKEFPPQKLVELVGPLLWRSPEAIARDKAVAQRWIDRGVPEDEARRAFNV
jgi:hypothetical protein